jgi:peroxiredoxin
VAHALESLTVFDPDGRRTRLGQLWAERTAVLVFLRHFGCLFCRQQMANLAPLSGAMESRGAELIAIGHGSLDEARAFRDELRPAVRVFTDPTRQADCAVGMHRGPRSVFTLGTLSRSITAWRQGFRQTAVAGDPFQQGGVVIVAPSGEERYRFVSREAGEHPPAAEVLAAL